MVSGGLCLWLREGYERHLLFWYGGKCNIIRVMVDLLWHEVSLWGVRLMVPAV